MKMTAQTSEYIDLFFKIISNSLLYLFFKFIDVYIQIQRYDKWKECMESIKSSRRRESLICPLLLCLVGNECHCPSMSFLHHCELSLPKFSPTCPIKNKIY